MSFVARDMVRQIEQKKIQEQTERQGERDTKNTLLLCEVRMSVQATSDSTSGSLASYMQETGNYRIIVCDSLSSCNTWCDLLQLHKYWIPTMFTQPASQPCDVSDKTHLEEQHQQSPWSNTGGFDSENTVTFSSSTSPSTPHWSIHHTDRQCVLTCARCH